jgi:fatty-acyl-CoA synthase
MLREGRERTLNATAKEAEMLSYAHGADDRPLIGQTIGDFFDAICESHAGHEALVSRHQGIRWTYRELGERVDELARALIALGIRKGDRVGIWSPNHAEWVLAQFATAKIGAIPVNVNPAYRVHELEYALRQSGCATLILAPPFKTSDYAALLRELCPELGRSRPGELHAEKLPELRTVIAFGPQRLAGAYHWEDVLALAARVTPDALAARQREQEFDDPIDIQYTSGTTGLPKGATLAHHAILNNAWMYGECLRFSDRDRLCVTLPFFHTGGMVLSTLLCVTHAATVVIPAPLFDAETTLRTIAEERCTGLHGVPTMFIAELNHPDFARFDLSSLRTGFIGGSPCPLEIVHQVMTRMNMSDLLIAYGMTETSPIITSTTTADAGDKRASTVGRVFPHVECKIVDPVTGAIVPRGTPGELLTRGYHVMLGYWNNPQATSEAIDAARWMHTGDLATMDAEGYVNIVGRSKDMIIRGGENVYPREIEEFLYAHPAVADVQVIGVPDEKYGEEIMAWVRLKDGQQVGADDLRDFCRGQIAHYKVPRHWKFVDSYPMTVSGKVQKFKLREAAIGELGLARAAAIRTA